MSAGLLVATLVLAAGHFVLPAEALPGRAPSFRVALAALARGAIALAILVALAPGVAISRAVALAAGVASLAFALESACALVAALAPRPGTARSLVALAAGLVATAPLWLGPRLAVDDVPQARRDLVLAASPVVTLAVLVGEDVLRSEAAYRSTPLARVRYAYPRAESALASWLGAGALALAARRALVSPSPKEDR